MTALTHADLYGLEQYARVRPDVRAKVIEHKKNRRVALGAHAALYFEDRLTMQYQIQEMLRIERIFEPEAIQAELDTYNPLIPDGRNWKATFMVEYEEVDERRAALARLKGVEKGVWMRVGDFPKIAPIANEDLDRETDEKTSAVHFLRFELTPEMAAAVKAGTAVSAGIDHPALKVEVLLPPSVRDSLAADLA